MCVGSRDAARNTQAPASGRSIDELCQDLESTDSDKVRRAREALIVRGKPAVPAVARRLRSENRRTAEDAVTILGKIGRDAESAIPEIYAALSDGLIPADAAQEALHYIQPNKPLPTGPIVFPTRHKGPGDKN